MSPSAEGDVLVLGSRGLLGSHVCHAFSVDEDRWRIHRHGAERFHGPDSVRRYLAGLRPSVVVNCIGYLGAEPEQHYRVNGCLPRAIADWTGARCSLIHVSTNAVFAPSETRRWGLNDEIRPETAYECAKAFGEDPRALVIRTTFLGDSGIGRNLWERLKRGEPYKDAWFNGVSAWTLARRIVELARRAQRERITGTLHVHAAEPVRIAEIAKLVGSSSPCVGTATNARLLAGDPEATPIATQLVEYEEKVREISAARAGLMDETLT